MEWTLKLLSEKLGLELRGDDCRITGLNTLESAGPGDVTFLANPRYISAVENSEAAAVVISPGYAHLAKRALVSQNPYYDFARMMSVFAKVQGSFSGISDRAHIHPGAKLGTDVTVYPFVYIGAGADIGAGSKLFPGVYVGENCTIGEGCVLYPNAVLMSDVKIGKECVISAGVVLGADGFGFVRDGNNMFKIPQIGSVALGDHVDVGANSTIDRAAMDVTSVGQDTKIDNLVQIGHNCTVGRACLIVSQVGISGSTHVGDRVTMAGQVGVAGHLSIGDDVTIGPQTGVPKDIPANATVGGTPAMDKKTFLRTAVIIPKLPEMYSRLKQLETELAEIKKALAESKK